MDFHPCQVSSYFPPQINKYKPFEAKLQQETDGK